MQATPLSEIDPVGRFNPTPFISIQPNPFTPISLEAEFPTIKREYLALREAKMASDYRTDTEHSLHKGQWE